MYSAQFFRKIVTKVPFELLTEFFAFHDRSETACTLLMRPIDGKGVHFKAITLQTSDIVRHDRFEYPVLIFGLLPFAIGNMQFFRIGPGRLGHDLVTSVRAAFTVVRMIASRGAFYLHHFFDDLLHRGRFQTCCFGQFGICVGRCRRNEECHDKGKEFVGD